MKKVIIEAMERLDALHVLISNGDYVEDEYILDEIAKIHNLLRPVLERFQ